MMLRKSGLLAIFCLFVTTFLQADPRDEAYYNTFYILSNGMENTDSIWAHRQSLLQDVGGKMPKNLKVGSAIGGWFMVHTEGNYFDYVYDPAAMGGLDAAIANRRATDTPGGIQLNGMPWGDASADQSRDTLHNFLEIYNGGELLQVDRNGYFRKSSTDQDPTIDENHSAFSPYLEMQLTLSRNCEMVQDYFHRNNRIISRHFSWYREENPDLMIFASTSSEFAMNAAANHDYCDYSSWSKGEFRDWLRGAGLYEGQGQFADLAAFNAAFGFSHVSWDEVEPPVTPNWTGGSYWSSWHNFRIRQVTEMTGAQIDSSRSAGIGPDFIYGHQIPAHPGSSNDLYRLYATPYTTTFNPGGSNGITTYGGNASDSSIFSALYSNDKNWGIFEYNPLSTSESANLAALETVWENGGHIISPYVWASNSQPTYEIEGTPFEMAMRTFVANHETESPPIMAPYEAAPEARDPVWAMSEADDVENSSGLTDVHFTTGILYATTTATDPALSLELDEAAAALLTDKYYALSMRLFMPTVSNGERARLEWQDGGGEIETVEIPLKAGWNVYRVNLGVMAEWREKAVQALRLRPSNQSGRSFQLDWVRLHSAHCWHFEQAGEYYSPNLENPTIGEGQMQGTDDSGDGFLYLSTDKQNPSEDADRAFVDADFFKVLRFRLTASAEGSTQLYWRRRGTGFFYYSSIPVQAGTHSYVFDMSQLEEWHGQVTLFRIDPVNKAGVDFALDYVSFTPKRLPPRPTNTDLFVYSSTSLLKWDQPVEPDVSKPLYDLRLCRDFEGRDVAYQKAGLDADAFYYTTPYPGVELPALEGFYWWSLRTQGNGEEDFSSWSIPMPLYVHTWQFNDVEDGTNLNNLTEPEVVDGIWTAQTTGGDPYLSFHMAGMGRGLNADLYHRFRCRLRLSGGSGDIGMGELFFVPAGKPIARLELNLPSDGQWRILDVDLSENPDWTGSISMVRLDPAVGGLGVQVELDWAEFQPEGMPEKIPASAQNWALYDRE